MFVILALTSSTQKPHIPTFGQVAVTATWASNSNDDVDLYVRDPSGNVCFFANTNLAGMHLEHDDLGTVTSGTVTLANGRKIVTGFNGERTVISTVVPGEYTVNVHLYRQANASHPVPVTVQFWQLQGNDRVLLSRTVVLAHEGDEKTIWRVTLDAQGRLRSTNTRPAYLVFSAAIPTISPSPSGRAGYGFP